MVSLYIFFSLVTLYTCIENTLGSQGSCQNGTGEDYLGDVSITNTGFACLKWSSVNVPEYSSVGDHNFCRNPDGHPSDITGVWCFSSRPDAQAEYCDVPECIHGDPVCSNYVELTDSWREISYVGRAGMVAYVDSDLDGVTWYRFNAKSSFNRPPFADQFPAGPGTKLPTGPAVGGGPDFMEQICGTQAVAWINGTNPTNEDGIVTRDVCFEWQSNSCCGKTTVKVAKCGDSREEYFVYQLQPVPVCYIDYRMPNVPSAYCAIN